jgi:hypothetical protein
MKSKAATDLARMLCLRARAGWLMTLLAGGCVSQTPLTPPPEDHEPIGMQLLRAAPSLRDERFSTLLDFETSDDAVFCSETASDGSVLSAKVAATADGAIPHSGRGALRVDPQAKRLSIKLSSLLAGRPFPGEWALVGAFFYSDVPARISVGFDPALPGVKARDVDLPPRQWTALFVELPDGVSSSSVSSPALSSPPNLVFDFPSPHAAMSCDDVMLVNNDKLLVTSPETGDASASNSGIIAGTMPPWSVRRRGLHYVGTSPGRFDFSLLNKDASASGWVVDEANNIRAIFHADATDNDPARKLCVYADGRAFWNGQYRPMSAAGRDPVLAAQHATPARIEVTEGMGRVDRNTPGDANNDGYNETTGSYRLRATGSRIEFRFIPAGVAVLSPIIEISGLPFGKALITLEGRLVEQSGRSAEGNLLIELPARLDRPATVDVRIEQ